MLNKKEKLITNLVIFAVVLVVFCVGFLPEKAVTISGTASYSAIYNGDRQKSNVALMFNVYENSDVVDGILKVLNESQVKATFFVGGCFADDNGSLLNKIINEGHEIGNHGYFHKDHKKLNESGNLREIDDCDKIVSALTGYKMKLFAPPSGSFSKSTLKVAESLGYKTIMWSLDSIDWRDSDKNLIISRTANKAIGGDFILFHPKAHTLEVLPEILSILKQKNLKPVTVSECLGLADIL